MKMNSLSSLLVIFLACGASASEDVGGEIDSLVLTRDGQPGATIVLAEQPTASAQLAAYELQHYVQKISGATLPIVREPQAVAGARILVGASVAAAALGLRSDDFDEQEYAIKTFPQTLALIGRDGQNLSEVRYEDYGSLYDAAAGPIGTCYAVHAFLETVLGVRWYYPNEAIGEVVPTRTTVTINELDIRRKPDAPIRSLYPLFANTEQLYFIDWDEREKFQSSLVDARASLLYWVRNRMWGGMRFNANHSFHGYDIAFGASHPEWFSTKSYAKMQQLDYQMGVQPCLTSPGFLEQVVEIARGYFDGNEPAHPDFYRAAAGRFFPVVPNDNTNMCGCEDCRAKYRNDFGPIGNASHYVWGFVNDVAKRVRQTHPDAMIAGLAYFNYTTPPKGMVFEPNVVVTFCKFYTGYANRNYQEQDYQRIAEYVNQNKARFFTTWEYLLKPHISEWAFPCMVPHVHADDVQRLSEIGGFMGGTNQYLYMNTYSGGQPGSPAWVSPVLDFMNLYWRIKLYDDLAFDIDDGLEEYYETFFGPGAAGMKRFYTDMENRWMTIGGGVSSREWWGKMGTRDFIEQVTGHIEEARQATQEGSIYRQRVELIDAGILQHMVLARARYEDSAMSEFAPIANTAVARAAASAARPHWASDATWAQAPTCEIERTHFHDPVPQKTTFKIAYDDEFLYVKARCLEPHLEQMKAATRDRDIGGFSDDSIELFIDPVGRGETYYHLCINSLGAVYDALENPTAIGATATVSWDSAAKVQTGSGEGYWELRVAIPFASMGGKAPAPGSAWRFNLCRNRYADPDGPPYSAWSPTLGGFHNSERFGIITFNALEDQGKLLWSCDFQGDAFAPEADSGQSPLIGVDGWYENPAYANLGWDKAWQVVEREGNRLAVCDVNQTNLSDIVPMHVVNVFPGIIAIEVDYRRLAMLGNMPQLVVADVNGQRHAYFYVSHVRDDLVVLDYPGNRQTYGPDHHRLGNFAAPDKWFGLKLEINTISKRITGFVRSEGGEWVQLNQRPLPYVDPEAQSAPLFLSFGTRKHETVDHNVVEMDNIRVTQLRRTE